PITNSDGSVSLQAQVPAGAETGPVTVSNANGSGSTPTYTVIRPTITVTASLTAFSAQVGTPSASQSYTVSGTNMEGKITTAAPAEFEVSLDNGRFYPQVEVTLPAGGTSIGATTIYVRYNPTTAGTHSGEIFHTSLNATDVRLAVNGSSVTPLPVELLSFRAAVQGNKALLTWVTASEKDNSHFEVETSLSGVSGFEKVGRVESKTTNSSTRTSYGFTHDMGNASGTRYYRLKQVDLDGTYAYSKVVAVTGRAQGLELQVLVAPNPLNYNSKVYITVEESGKAAVTLHDMSGKRIYQKTVDVREGQTEVQLPLYDQLTNGLYILTVEVNGLHRQLKVVKQ
ncbi:T9SS type A sorting domain-containing protein, partial [Pontibacter toksunensis]